jgi:MFS family permease
LVARVLGISTWNLYLVFGASFFRQVFQVSRSFVSTYIILSALSAAAGSLFGGKLVNKVGRKTISIASLVVLGLLTILYTNIPSLWLSLIVGIISASFGGIMQTSFNSYTLEQVPEYRGTMMSTYSVATSIGQVLCSTLGGFILIFYNYSLFGLVFGVIGLFSGLILQLFSVDPIKTRALASN